MNFPFFSNNKKNYFSKGVKLSSLTKVENSKLVGDVSIGENSIINQTLIRGTVSIGRYTTINGPNTDIIAELNPVRIGSFCSIARNVSIQEFNHNTAKCTSYFISKHVFNKSFKDDIYSKGPIEIGNDIWIGTQSVILSGAKIGDGAVVAANSVVTDVIPPYAIVGGTPARVIKFRFEDKLVERLMEIKWWEWELEKIRRNYHLFDGVLAEDKLYNLVD